MCRQRREMEFASVALSFSSTRFRASLSLSSSVVDDDPPLSLSRRHLSSATGDGIRVCRSLSLNQSRCQIASATRNGIRVCRALSLSLVEGRHVSSAMRHGIRVSRSLNLVVVSSATRQGIRVSRALSLSSTRDGWVCSCALVDGRRRDMESASLPCVVGV